MEEPVTFATFAHRVGQEFGIDVDQATTIPLVLTSANRHGGDTDQGGVVAGFSLIFAGPAEPQLPQRIYRFTHAELAVMEIFIVPIGRDESGVRYEAIFG